MRPSDNFLSYYNQEDGWLIRQFEETGQRLSVWEQYVWSFSLLTETISKVGYGLPYRPNTVESMFLYIVIFASMNTLTNLFYQVS